MEITVMGDRGYISVCIPLRGYIGTVRQFKGLGFTVKGSGFRV